MISNKLIITTYSAPWSNITNNFITNKDTKKDNYVYNKVLPVYNILLSFLFIIKYCQCTMYYYNKVLPVYNILL